LSDQAGNIAFFPGIGESSAVYYLANGGVTYSHASSSYTAVFGGAAPTPSRSARTRWCPATTATSSPPAPVPRSSRAPIPPSPPVAAPTWWKPMTMPTSPPAAADFITLTSLTGAVLAAGAGTDTLSLASDSVFTLGDALGSATGIDVLDFASDGTNDLIIVSASSVSN
jgi:hypothetical protein